MCLCFAQIPSHSLPLTGHLSSCLCSVPWLCFLSSGSPLSLTIHYFEVLPSNKPCYRKGNRLPLLLYKMNSHSLHFIGSGTYCLRNLAGADHKNKHGQVRKLPEFPLCCSLVLYSFQRRKWTTPGLYY